MSQNAGNETLCGVGELVFIIRVVECISVPFKEGNMSVHAIARQILERFRHECRLHTVFHCNLLNDVAERHHVIRHSQRIGVAQIDFLLTRRIFVMGELHRDSHVFQHRDRFLAKAGCAVVDRLVKVTAIVRWHRRLSISSQALYEEKLNLRVDERVEALVGKRLNLAAQHLAWICPRRLPVGHDNVAEHARGRDCVFFM